MGRDGMGSRAYLAAAPLIMLAACDLAQEKAAEIQVVGSAIIEKPAEIFRISGSIVELADDRVAALQAASDKLDRLSAEIGGVDGLASYRFLSSSATATVVRPTGCDLEGRNYGDV